MAERVGNTQTRVVVTHRQVVGTTRGPWASRLWVLLSTCFGLVAGTLLAATATLPPAEDVRATIAQILARREYQEPQPSALDAFYRALSRIGERILNWILKPIAWLIDRLSSLGADASPVSRWMVISLLTGLLVLVLLHLYYVASGAFGHVRRRRSGQDLQPSRQADPAELTRQAQTAAAGGEYREAVRLLYIACLLRLDRAGLLVYHPSITNWAYVDVLSDRPSVAPFFRDFTALADRAMYGVAPVDAEQFHRSKELARRLEVDTE